MANENFYREKLYQLSEIGANMEDVGIPAIGDYKGYDFSIDEKNQVTIESKAEGERPKITLLKSTEEKAETLTIHVKVTYPEGETGVVTKPDGTTTGETEFDYTATANDLYVFRAEGSNGRKGVGTIEITNLNDIANNPIITSTDSIPILKSTGVELTEAEVTISFDTKRGLEHYYSLDNGTTWKRYTGPFAITKPVSVLAKTEKNGVKLAESSSNVNVGGQYIGTGAYDGNDSTAYRSVGLGGQILKVDPSVWGRTIRVTAVARTSYNGRFGVTARGADGSELRRIAEIFRAVPTYGTSFAGEAEIPEGCVDILLHGWGQDQQSTINRTDVYEMKLLPEE